MKHMLLSWIFCIAIIGSMTACNTLEGAGEDMQDAGEAIEDAAEKHD